jgi:hypothetical protein
VEHPIVTGDAKLTSRHPYRVPFSLRKESESQVQDKLAKEGIEESSSPCSAPAISRTKEIRGWQAKITILCRFSSPECNDAI